MSRARILIFSVVAVLWLFAVTLNYYVVHKPFSANNALAILDALANVIVAGALFVLAAAMGRHLLRGFQFASPLEALVFHTGLGLGLVSFTTFGLGLAGLLNRILFWLVLLIAAFLLRNDLLSMWHDLRAVEFPLGSRFERALALFIAGSLALAFLVALTPTLGWDAQLYHLLAGKIALAQGRIAPPPDVLSLSDPSLVEMLYLTAMALKDDGATALIHLGFALLTFGALFAFSQRFFSARIGWLAGAILLAVPSFLLVSTWPYNDAALAFYAFGALYAAVIAKERREARWLILAGTLAGLALGMKYTALIVPLALVVVLWIGSQRLSWAHAVPLLIPFALVASPWYLRNWIFMGNPIYPFFFGGRYWDAFRNHWYSLFGTGLINQPLRLLIAPWEATILGQEGKASYEATVGPLLLACLPLLILVGRGQATQATARPALRDVVVFGVILYAFWLIGTAISRSLIQTRLLFPAFPAFALMGAVALDGLPAFDHPQFSLARFARWLVLLVLSLTLLERTLGFISLNPLLYLTGFETRDEYLAQRLTPPGYWDALQFLGHLPTSKAQTPRSPVGVLFLWEPRAYYAPDSAAVQPDEILDTFAHLRYQYHDAAGIVRALREQGYQYMLLNRWGLDFQLSDQLSGLSLDDVRVLQELTTHYTRQVYGMLPLDYSTDSTGTIRIRDVDREPYSVYFLVSQAETNKQP